MKHSDASREERVGTKLNNKCGKGLQNISWNLLLPFFFVVFVLNHLDETICKQTAA